MESIKSSQPCQSAICQQDRKNLEILKRNQEKKFLAFSTGICQQDKVKSKSDNYDKKKIKNSL